MHCFPGSLSLPSGCQRGVKGDRSMQTFDKLLPLSCKFIFLPQLCDTGAGPLLTTFFTRLLGGLCQWGKGAKKL